METLFNVLVWSLYIVAVFFAIIVWRLTDLYVKVRKSKDEESKNEAI